MKVTTSNILKKTLTPTMMRRNSQIPALDKATNSSGSPGNLRKFHSDTSINRDATPVALRKFENQLSIENVRKCASQV